MSDFKLEFQLKQHTPLIHFQYKQAGATLRATELKPKLDRFIVKKLGGKDKIDKSWFVNEEKEALNYKVRIEADDVNLHEINKSDKIPLYFGNMGKEYDKNPKAFSFTENNIIVTIQSFQNELRKKIEQFFPYFIAETNFGTRQSKGFGSFFLDLQKHNVNIDKIFEGIHYLKIKNNISKIDKNNVLNSYKDVLNVINYYYQRLKSGINYGKRKDYSEAFLLNYLMTKKLGYTWEKPWLKEKFIGLASDPSTKKYQPKYARALLGLQASYRLRKPKGTWMPITVESKVIDRHKSPITFKPIILNDEVRIYILTNSINTDLLDKEFQFSAHGKTYNLKTPDSAFDINDLIKEYHAHLGAKFSYTLSGETYNVEIK